MAAQEPEKRSAVDRRVRGVSLGGYEREGEDRQPLDGADHGGGDFVFVVKIEADRDPRERAEIPDAVELFDPEIQPSWKESRGFKNGGERHANEPKSRLPGPKEQGGTEPQWGC